MTKISNKLKNTRKVVFNKDFKVGKTVYYKKGETHFIHEKNVERLKLSSYGTVSKVDIEKEVEKAKKAIADAEAAESKKK